MPGTDGFYRQVDKILLAGILGFSAVGSRTGDRVADELVKIREVVAVAMSKLEDLDKRTTHLERRYLETPR